MPGGDTIARAPSATPVRKTRVVIYSNPKTGLVFREDYRCGGCRRRVELAYLFCPWEGRPFVDEEPQTEVR